MSDGNLDQERRTRRRDDDELGAANDYQLSDAPVHRYDVVVNKPQQFEADLEEIVPGTPVPDADDAGGSQKVEAEDVPIPVGEDVEAADQPKAPQKDGSHTNEATGTPADNSASESDPSKTQSATIVDTTDSDDLTLNGSRSRAGF